MAPTRKTSERQTRTSRAGSPYSGRPGSNAAASVETAQKPTHRYGLRGMLSNLIWGSPTKSGQEEQPKQQQQQQEGRRDVQMISDDDSEDDEDDDEVSRRLTAREKGKGRAPNQLGSSSFGNMKTSQTLGDMRSIQEDQQQYSTASGEVNSSLAKFFAEKGSASLTVDERRRVSELLLGPSGPAPAPATVPTALTPSFSFVAPVQSTLSANVSILSPAFKRSTTTSANLSGLAQPSGFPRSGFNGGLTGSQSMSSLSSLAAASSNSTYLPGSANPRSAVNRRAASRPLYLGAGYSSQAIARRKRAQAQVSSLFNNLDNFDSEKKEESAAVGTPGKRRRVGDEAATSSVFTVGSPSASASASRPAVPTFSQSPSNFPSPSPNPVAPPGRPAQPVQPLLFSSAPHLKAKFGMATPVKPSPLRQAAAASSPGTPGSSAGHVEPKQPTPPRTTTRTASLMKDILGDTSQPEPTMPTKSASDPFIKQNGTTIHAATITPSQESKRVPRESLIKQPVKLSTTEILERTMPPELRSTPNGKQARPKPPPVPGSARKTRAAAAAEEKQENETKQKEREQERQKDREARRSKSRGKEPVPASAEPAEKREKTPAQSNGKRRTEEKESDAPEPSSKKAAFSFAPSPASSSPAPSLFSAPPLPPVQPIAEKPKAPTSLFSFTPPASVSVPSGPKTNGMPAAPSDPKQIALGMSAISLPAFTLFESTFSFSSSNEDTKVKALKDAVREMPARELRFYDLL